ncbi:hypothetical protein BUZ56_07380 [Staphylococcus hyicus]|uniref:tail tube TT1 domain-containing protein n=1 Tax=Staphylococcus hyicus TaxID=1284 RepID=UPI000D1E5FC2|nr:phage tail protein [Staphylococcus hyicus]PTJ72022.1 hypothetical protein BUZ58_05665 [Staphylococcus hyicus]PTJ88157.1 hypothetical protein BUZ56_07380 [Staphylococcus hyicus]
MALILEDTQGNQYFASVGTTQVSNYSADGMITFKLIENEQTAYYINDVSKMWRVRNVKGNTDNQRYTVVIVKRTSPKDVQVVEVTAREEQFDYLANTRVYANISGSRTANNYFAEIFNGTPYTFSISTNVLAVEWENAGDGNDRLSMFLKGLNRYGLEFKFDYDSNHFELAEEISRRPAYHINKRLNANNVHHEEDATAFYTYIEGYGNFADDEGMHEAKLKKSHTSDLAAIPGIGKRHAPALTDGRITSEDTMLKKLSEIVEDSLKVSVTLDFVALPDEYPFAQPEIGDIIPVIDKDIGYNQELRVNEMKTYRDAKHRVYKRDVTVGDRSRLARFNSESRGAINTVKDLVAGRYQLSTDVMPPAVNSATVKLLAANTELGFGEYGIRAVDKDNPNYVTLMNSAGLGVSTDGGQTFTSAITRGAINADLITAGSIRANIIQGGMLSALNGWVTHNLDNGTTDYYGSATINFNSNNNRFRMLHQGNIMEIGTKTGKEAPMFYMGGHRDINGEVSPYDFGFAGIRVIGDTNRTDLSGDRVTITEGAQGDALGVRFNFESALNSRAMVLEPLQSYTSDKFYIGGQDNWFDAVMTHQVSGLRFLRFNTHNVKLYRDGASSDAAAFTFEEDDIYFVRGGVWSMKEVADKALKSYNDINGSNGILDYQRGLAGRISRLETDLHASGGVDSKIGWLNADVDKLKSRMDSAESNIRSLAGRVSTLERR